MGKILGVLEFTDDSIIVLVNNKIYPSPIPKGLNMARQFIQKYGDDKTKMVVCLIGKLHKVLSEG